MSSIAAAALPVPLAPQGQGFGGVLPVFALQPGVSPDCRNVIPSQQAWSTALGWRRIHAGGNSNLGGRIMHIAQYFKVPYTGFEPALFCKKDGVWFADPVAQDFRKITPPYFEGGDGVPYSSTTTFDNDWVLATGRYPWIWQTADADDPENPTQMRPLKGLPAIKLTNAFVTCMFEPHLVLGRVKMDGVWNPGRYVWSDTNRFEVWLPGTQPDGTTSVSGFADLPPSPIHETPVIVEILPLRENLILYANWEIWSLQFVGAPLMWQRRCVQQEVGARASCNVVTFGDRHYFWASDGEVYEFNGVDKQAVGGPVATWAHKRATGGTFAWREFYPDSVCFAFSTDPENTRDADTMIRFNVSEGKWSVEDFDFVAARSLAPDAFFGPLSNRVKISELAGQSIDELSGVSIDDLSVDPGSRVPTQWPMPVGVFGRANGDVRVRGGWDKNGSARTAYVRSPVIDCGSQSQVKHLSVVEIHVEPDPSFHHGAVARSTPYELTLNVRCANRSDVDWHNLPVSQSQPVTVNDPDADHHVWFRVPDSRYFQLELTSTSSEDDWRPWALHRWTAWVIPGGLR